MPETTRWTKEEIEALGRPVIGWDVCPHCQKPAKLHFYDKPSQDLVCPIYSVEELEDLRKSRADFINEARVDATRRGWKPEVGTPAFDAAELRQAERKRRALTRQVERAQQKDPITGGRRKYFAE